MKVILNERPDPRRLPLLWAFGTLILPAILLAGFAPGFTEAGGTAPPAEVSVVITHDGIRMPDSAFAGTIALAVTNRDSVTHRLNVKAVGAESPVARVGPVTAGASAQKRLTLDAGSYQVYCPDGEAHGLTHLLSVLDRPGSSSDRH